MKIAEVSEKFGLSIDTLRYYERIGLIPPVTRNSGGIREYGELDLARVDFIKCMRTAGLSLDVLIKYVGLVQAGESTMDARKKILIEEREKLLAKIVEYQNTLAILDHKIEVYDNRILAKEKNINLLETQEV